MPPRARPNSEHLFSSFDFYSLQENQRQQMGATIAKADPELIRTGDIEVLATDFAEQFSMNAPTLLAGALSINVEEAEIDVAGDIRFGAFGPGPHYAPGIRASYHVPYSGESKMFQCRASTFSISLRPVDIGKDELTLTYERTDQNVAATKGEFDLELAQIEQSLGWLRQDCRTFNSSLGGQARELILARKSRLTEVSQGIQSLGIPIKSAKASPVAVEQNFPVEKTNSGRKPVQPKVIEQFDIALSFAGENRPYVEPVAEGLKAAGIKVFYDRFEAANLWGKNLIDHLADIYRNSRYVVMFISKEYVEKAWTTHERKHAQERALFAQEEYILPARFDDTEMPGMTTTVAFQDLRHTTPAELVALILTKLQRAS